MFKRRKKTSVDLQHIAQEVYKKNAELAIKNKTLSLLHELYQISTTSLEVGDLSDKFTRSIARILHFPFVAILTKTKDSRHMKIQSVTTILSSKKPMSFRDNKVEFHQSDICVQVSQKGKMRRSRSFEKVVKAFIPEKDIQAIVKKQSVVTTFVLPLHSGNKHIGVLVLGIDRAYQDLNAFEKQAITNLTNVASVAIDKALAYQRLQVANDKLRHLDELKTEFLSIASHQLRTPLSIIKGFTSLLDEGAYGEVNDEQKQIFHNIDESNERLIKLVDEFLNISRLEQGRTKYSFEEMDMVDLIDGVVGELNEKAHTKEVVIEYHKPEGFEKNIADAEKLRHAVYNYIDNAIKYTKDRSHIDVYLEEKNKGIQVHVKDEGVGLDAEDIKNLFQKFYRSPKVLRDFQGTGLGLFVVRQFIEAHGGRVWVTSPGVDQGSEFFFWIPKKVTKMVKTKDGEI